MEGMFIYPSRTQPLPFSPFICLSHPKLTLTVLQWFINGYRFRVWSMVTGSSQPRLSFPAIKGQLRHLDVMANICDQTSNSDKHGKVLFRRIDPKKFTPSKSIATTQKIIKKQPKKTQKFEQKMLQGKADYNFWPKAEHLRMYLLSEGKWVSKSTPLSS